MKCTAVNTSDDAWCQAQLSLQKGDLGLCALSSIMHSFHLFLLLVSVKSTVNHFNGNVSPDEKVDDSSITLNQKT